MVKFVPLDRDDDESVEQLLLVIDTSIQYGEDLEVTVGESAEIAVPGEGSLPRGTG